MRFIIIILLLLNIQTICFSQNKEELEVLKVLIENEMVKRQCLDDSIFIMCEKGKKLFDSSVFLQQVEYKIPSDILKDLEINKPNNKDSLWAKKLLSELIVYSDGFILNEKDKCYSYNEIKERIHKTERRSPALTISQPIFDKKSEHCFVSIAYSSPGFANGNSFFLKKIYGKWFIIYSYGQWTACPGRFD